MKSVTVITPKILPAYYSGYNITPPGVKMVTIKRVSLNLLRADILELVRVLSILWGMTFPILRSGSLELNDVPSFERRWNLLIFLRASRILGFRATIFLRCL